ncbi:DMP19 family protein [Jannaschia marina]|uniref:DMP19 family protein n=1 Tax=Jannaschia marina TaxID=2741674 RepID=UPI0015C8E47E|nr:hypothetical protein [Jannaschia marina]
MFKPLIVATALLAPLPAHAADCIAPGTLRLPMSGALQTMAIRIEYAFDGNGDADFETPLDERILPQLREMTPARRDASLLALLRWQTIGTLPLFRVTMSDAAPLFDTYLEVLERQTLTEAAHAFRAARAAFPVWNVSPAERYAQWSDGRGTVYPAVDRPLRAASERFMRALPAIEARTEALVRKDPQFRAEIESLRAATPDMDRFLHVTALVETCLHATDDPRRALLAQPAMVRHAVLAGRFILEAGNGSSHQYFFNSTGDDARLFEAALRALGLHAQADDLAAAMAIIGAPYPEETEARREAIAGLSASRDEALAQPTWIMDDAALYDAVFDALRRDGYWPE